MVLDEMARRAAADFRFDPKWNADCLLCGGRMLMKPQTFMNLSGEAVGSYARYFRIEPGDVLVVIDDVSLPVGAVRMRPSGSAGGHNGLESVMVHLATELVPRLRVGIGGPDGPMTRHVLGSFRDDEDPKIRAAIQHAADAIDHAIAHGIDAAMTLYNKKTTA
jgi:PTH1 family peptidyl-tRNA hydrolase